jgi:ferrochelatase
VEAVLLVAHGTVERLDDLPAFLANIRRGRPAPDEVVREVRRRYEAIGGRSPLLDVTRSLAAKVERALAVPTRVAMRLWEPYPKEVLAELATIGVKRVCVVPLAQHSAAVYGAAVVEAARPFGFEVSCAANWGRTPALIDAFAGAAKDAIDRVPAPERSLARVVLSAHSLPTSIIAAGDPYEDEVRAAAELVAARLGPDAPPHVVCFQSQGMSPPGARGLEPATPGWLGPDLRATFERIANEGARHVIVAPIGFLADHVEILYDLDIEARAWAKELGMTFARTRSLNDSDELARAVIEVARPLLARGSR